MLGLRTQESEKFNKFWGLVQETAKKKHCVFFGDCGEGRDFENSNMEGEDFSGWLIPEEKVNTFQKEFLKNNVSDKWCDFIMFAIWNKENDNISVEFKKF